MKITQKGEREHFTNTGIYRIAEKRCRIFFGKQCEKERDVKKMQKNIKKGYKIMKRRVFMKRKKNIITTISKAAAAFSLLMGMVLGAGISSKAAAPKVDNNNDNIFTAANINLNTTYAGNSSTADEQDWYHFVIPTTAKESYFNIVFGSENENSVTVKGGWDLCIYKKGESDPFYRFNGTHSKHISSNLPFGPGEYYLRVISNGYGTYYSDENYNFQVKFTNNAHWETEYNDTWATASPINVNESYHGNLFEQSDEDCYTFTLSKPGEVVVTFGANPSEDITRIKAGWGFSLYEENAASSCINLGGVKAPVSSAKYNLSAGTYRIRINGDGYGTYNPGTETYDFKVTYKETQAAATKPNTTVNNNKNTVTSLKKSKVTVSSAKSKAKKKVYLKWKKNKYAAGYKIYRSTKKKSGYKCIATIKKQSKVSYTDKKVKSKKVYYYKIRAYRKNGKKTVYSGYSPVKKVKVK